MKREMIIDSVEINDDSDCWVIAEIGHNHQGSLERCKELFAKAKECGANAVKLQKRDNKNVFTAAMYNQPYNSENAYGDTYGSHREALEFGLAEYQELKRYAAELGITFFATAFDFNSADFLADLDMPVYKMASGDLKNTPLLKYVAKIGKPMIISTGGGTLEDVQRAYDAVMPINRQISFLQCTATYPTEPEEMNLRVISTFRERFPDVVIGLSDHQNGIALAVVAYALGARIIEKHFTINRAWKGSDQAFSLEPIGMSKMIRDLHRTRIAMGNGIKMPTAAEIKPLNKMAKSIVAARDLEVGHVITRADLALKSPAEGLPPYELERMIGSRLRRELHTDDRVMFEDLDGYVD